MLNELLPIIEFSSITLETFDGAKLKCGVSMNLIETIDHSLVAEWFEGADFRKYLSFRVLFLTDPATIAQLRDPQTDVYSGFILKSPLNAQFKDVLVDDILRGQDLELLKTTLSNGYAEYRIPYRTTFDDSSLSPKTLSVAVITHLDLIQLMQDFSLDLDIAAFKQEISRVTIEDVFLEQFVRPVSSIVQDCRVFYTSQQEPTDLMSLDRFITNGDASFRPNETVYRDTFSKFPVFSDPFISYDKTGLATFFFALDMRSAVRWYSVYGNYMNTVDDAIIGQILSKSRIRNLKIFRQCVNPYAKERSRTGNITTHVPLDESSPAKLIVVAGESVSGGEIHAAYTADSGEKRIGAINEKSITTLDPVSYFRFFAVTDWSIKEETYGAFQYLIEVDIDDGIREYFGEQFDQMLQSLNTIENYWSCGGVLKQFSYVSARLAVESFFTAFRVFYEYKPSDLISLKDGIIKILQPNTLNDQTYEYVRKILNDAVFKVSKLVNMKTATGPSRAASSVYPAETMSRTKATPQLIHISKILNSIINVDEYGAEVKDYVEVGDRGLVRGSSIFQLEAEVVTSKPATVLQSPRTLAEPEGQPRQLGRTVINGDTRTDSSNDDDRRTPERTNRRDLR